LREELYPFWAKAFKPIELDHVTLYAEPESETATPVTINVFDMAEPPPDLDDELYDELAKDDSLGGLRVGKLDAISLPATGIGPATLYLSSNSIRDLWIALAWKS
jgi:hypothetical protein